MEPDLRDTNSTAPDTLSLFSGIGGLDLGAHIAGLRVGGVLDNDRTALACNSLALGTLPIVGDARSLDPRDVIRRSGVPIDGTGILIGGPPCTAFSHAGFWIRDKREGRDHQWGRIGDYLRYLHLLRPRAFILENVPGLLFKNHKPVFEAFRRTAEAYGYAVSYTILNGADFGVPQKRRRLFVVGVAGRTPFKFPPGPFAGGLPRTAGWALSDLDDAENPPEPDEKLGGKYADLLHQVPPGENYLFFTREKGHAAPVFEWRKKYWSFLLKLHPDQPSSTLPANRISNNGPFHWTNRRLRVREIARLQSFPDVYPTSSVQRTRIHLGNAVPPLIAAELVWQLRLFLGDCRIADRPDALETAMCPRSTAREVSAAFGEYVLPSGLAANM